MNKPLKTEYWRVTDRQTNGQTDILPRHTPRYAYVSHGKNTDTELTRNSPETKMTLYSLQSFG